MKKSIFGYVVAVGVGALGAYGLAKLDESRRLIEVLKKPMDDFDELDRSLSETEEYIHKSNQEVIDVAARVDRLLEVLEKDNEGFYERLREAILMDDLEVETE